MKSKIWRILLVLTAAVAVFALGCSDNTNDNPPVTPSISVTAPAAGASWPGLTVHNITWSAVGADAFDIKYSTNNGTSWISVAANVTGSSHSWTVPNTPATTCKVRVSSYADSTLKGESAAFTIAAAPPMLVLMANWDATANSLVPVGLDEMKFYLNTDSTYRQYFRSGSTELNELGTWTADADSVRWHATTLDGQPVNYLYANGYNVQQNGSVLNVRYLFSDGLYIISFTKF